MSLPYLSAVLQFDFAARSLQSPAEQKDYEARLREVENALLCQAFGGQVPAPDSQQRLQRYLNGEIGRREAFQALYQATGRQDN